MSGTELWTLGVASPRRAGDTAARLEAAGWDGMLVVDSQNLSGDPFVALAMAAAATTRLGLGTGVTNPSTRHPAAAAAGIGSVQLLSGGRAVLGIGRGDSALAHLGQAPASVGHLERYVRTLRSYLRGEGVAYEALAPFQAAGGRSVDHLGLAEQPDDSRVHWLPGELAPVPVEVAATGPRVLSLAARHADRVMLAVGADLARVRWAIDLVKAEWVAAGRTGAPVIGAYVNVVAHPDRATARALVAGGLSTFARFSVMDGHIHTPVDDSQREVLQSVHRAYDMTHHTQSGSAQTQALTPEFIDRFAVVGPAGECGSRLAELAALGIDRFVVIGPSAGSDRAEAGAAVQRFVAEVAPAVRS